MRSNSSHPTPQQLTCDPELASLAALDLTLYLAKASLLARHPDIGNEISDDDLTTLVWSIIDSAERLRVLLRRYCAALARDYQNKTF
jgi:hypothetical protein